VIDIARLLRLHVSQSPFFNGLLGRAAHTWLQQTLLPPMITCSDSPYE